MICKINKKPNIIFLVARAARRAVSRTSANDELARCQVNTARLKKRRQPFAGHTFKSGIEQKLGTPGFIAVAIRLTFASNIDYGK